MRLYRFGALLLVQAALASSVSAQNQPPPAPIVFVDPVNGLSLDEAIAHALQQEPSLRALRATIEAARGIRLRAGLRRNPAISVERLEEAAGTDNQTMVNVEWPLDLFRRRGRVAVAEREVAVAELSVEEARRRLAASVRARYGEALVAVRELTVLEDLIATVQTQHELLRARVDQGSSPALERDLVEVELRRLEADRVLQIGSVEIALSDLRRAIGMPPRETLRLRDTLEAVVNRSAGQTSGVDVVNATDGRADVREARARIELADARVGQAEREGRFDVSVVGGYARMDASFPQFGLSATTGRPERIHGTFNYIAVGAMVSVPMFSRNQGEIAVAGAERSRAAAELDAARLSAQSEIAVAMIRDERSRQAVKLYGGDIRTLARQNLSVIQQSYELGRSTVLELVAEQKRYLELERGYTETLRAAYEAWMSLATALGEVR